MADLLELVDAPPPIEARALEASRRNAQWGETFMPSANMAQRSKYRQDIATNLADELANREWAQAQELKTSKGAQDLYFRTQNLAMDRQREAAALEEREQRMQFAKERLPEEISYKRAQTSAALALEESRRRKMESDTLLTASRAKADSTFHTALKDNIDAGTDARTALRKAYLAAPGASREAVANAHKLATGEERPIEEVVAEFEQARALTAQGATVTTGARGTTLTARPPAAEQPDTALDKRLSQLESLRARTGLDDDQKAGIDEAIRITKERMQPAQPNANPAAPVSLDEPAAFKEAFSAAKSGEELVFRGKKYRKP